MGRSAALNALRAGVAVLALGCATWSPPARAENKVCEKVMKQTFDQLLTQLDDDSFEVRECSQDELRRRLLGREVPAGDYRKLVVLSRNGTASIEQQRRAQDLTSDVIINLVEKGKRIYDGVRVHNLNEPAQTYEIGNGLFNGKYANTDQGKKVFAGLFAKMIAVQDEVLVGGADGTEAALKALGKYVTDLSKEEFATLGLTVVGGKPATQRMFIEQVVLAKINVLLPGFKTELEALKIKGAAGLPQPIPVPPKEQPGLAQDAIAVDLGLTYAVSVTDVVTQGGLYPFLFGHEYNPAQIPEGYRALPGDGVFRLQAEGGLQVSGPITIGVMIGKAADPGTVRLLRVADGRVTTLPTSFDTATQMIYATYDPGADSDQFGIFAPIAALFKLGPRELPGG